MESEDPWCVGIAGRKATLLGHVEIAPQSIRETPVPRWHGPAT